MITKEMIKNGIEQGVVRFVVDPNMEHGTVCAIGEIWFYFGGLTAEEENPDEYIKNVPIEDIVREIYETLKELRRECPDEYMYYLCNLREKKQKSFRDNIVKKIKAQMKPTKSSDEWIKLYLTEPEINVLLKA